MANVETALAVASIDRKGVTGAVAGFEAGLVGALGSIADAHNALMLKLDQAQKQLDPLLDASGNLVKRVTALEERQKGLSQDMQKASKELREMTRSSEFEKAISALQRGQDELQRTIAELLGSKIAESEAQQQKATQEGLSALEANLMARLNTQEGLLGTLSSEQRAQGGEQKTIREEQQNINDSILPRLRSDLVARVEGLAAGMSERADLQGTRLQRLEKGIGDQSAELKGIAKSLEQRALASKLDPLDARLLEAEKNTSASARALSQEVAQLDAQIKTAKSALADQIKSATDQIQKIIQEETRGVLNVVHADEGVRITQLENQFKESEAEQRRFFDRVGKCISGSREDMTSTREWAAKRIDSLEEALRQADPGRKQPEQQTRELIHLDSGSDAITGPLADIKRQQDLLRRRQERSDGTLDRLVQAVNGLGRTLDKIAPLVEDSDFSAAVTQCLSCGRKRSLSPLPRSHSPNIRIDGVGQASGVSCHHYTSPTREDRTIDSRATNKSFWSKADVDSSADKSHSCSAVRSRPTSASKRSGDGEGSTIAAAGAAHFAARVSLATSPIAPSTPSSQVTLPRRLVRPYSASSAGRR